ncbi:hypothetical protein [Fundidesulfovibrio putealis]|uniref:hypothetical protein n=1 Tax=Fundidesulfovibrio putealis TaxID=270496 RepID=UPI0004862200|nr:hypothetical protein [Fundidesulfovibrio putealis]
MTKPIAKSLLYFTLSIIALTALFQHYPHLTGYSDNTRFNHMYRLIDMMNAGHFMQVREGTSINADLYDDPGLGALAVMYIWIVKTFFDPSYVADWHIVYYIQFALYALVLAACCAASDSIVLVALTLISICTSFTLGPVLWQNLYGYWSYLCYWVPALAVIITYISVASLWFEDKLRKRSLPLLTVFLGLMTGTLGLLRQDAALVAQGAIALIILFEGFRILHFYINKTPNNATSPVKPSFRMLVFSLIFFSATTIPSFTFREILRLHQVVTGTNHAIAQGVHGMWHSLYIGLGHYPNKYGIKYDDSVGAEHALQEDPQATFASEKYMPTIRILYLRILTNDPAFFFKTTFRKHVEAIETMGGVKLVVFFLALSLTHFYFSRGKYYSFLKSFFPIWMLIIASIPPTLTIPHPNYILAGRMALVCGFLFLSFNIIILTYKRTIALGLHLLKYIYAHRLPATILAAILITGLLLAERHLTQINIGTAKKDLVFLSQIVQIAKIKTGLPLPSITGNSCSECPCRSLNNSRNDNEDDVCYANWRKALVAIWMAAAGQSPFNEDGRLVLETRLIHDPWGSPYGLDENAESIRSAGVDGIMYNDDDITLSLRP